MIKAKTETLTLPEQSHTRLLDFFIAGVQKGGTTALDYMLRQHPAIQMAREKEVHFFDRDDRGWPRPDYTRLHAHFDWSEPGVIRGETTPNYIYWPQALERLATYNPNAKIVLCLRHPAYRAHSHWRMQVKRKGEPLPFGEAIRSGRKRVTANYELHRIFSYVERGFYASQITTLLSLVDTSNVQFIRTDRFWTAPGQTLSQLCSFLGVEPIEPPVNRYVVSVESTGTAPMSPEDLRHLNALYAPDISETAQLTGLDLDDWLDPSYREPMTALGKTPLQRQHAVIAPNRRS